MDAVSEQMAEAEDEDAREQAAQAYPRCQELPDAVFTDPAASVDDYVGSP